jgi:hypothetical protein
MTDASPSATRLLFVVDNDFGALGVVMYMLHRRALAQHALILLPRRAYELHGATLGVACRPYGSLADILAAAEAHAPGVACLYSGYLLAAQRLLRVDEVGELVRALRARGCGVATSDPYIGTFSRLPEAELPPRGALALLGPLARRAQRFAMRRHVRRIEAILEDVPHIYPVEAGLPGNGRPPRFAFFNPLYVREALAPKPRWLYVIAQFDLELQEEKYGAERFADLVASRMREALDAGREPTFIGPRAITDALSRRFTDEPRVTLRAACPFAEFERQLLEAEAAFYWQIYSTSGFLRIWNDLPMFFFDPGHNARLLGPMHANGIESHFMGNPPVQLDIEKAFDAATLQALGERFRKAGRESRARLARLPTPEAMFAAIVARR